MNTRHDATVAVRVPAIDPPRAEAIRTLYLQMRNSALSALVVSTYMIGTAAFYTDWRVIAAWSGVQLAAQVARELLIAAWRRRRREDAELAGWARAYTIYMGAIGCLWGSTIFLFAHPALPISVALTLCCLYSIAAGSVPANAYNPPGLFALVAFMFVPIVARLLATGTPGYILLGLATGLYGVAMLGMCRVQARTLDEGFRIRFENTALLAELRVQTAEATAARRHAEQASLAKSQFLAAASHDLRQPLYALSLFSASLDTLRLDADGRAVVGNIHQSIEAMEQLFNGLLDLSRLDAGVVRPEYAPVSVDTLFDRLSQYFHPMALARGLELRLRSDGEWVFSDAILLEQVLSNLVANALRYTQHGGVLVAARTRRAGVRLEVWDTGVGIAPQDRGRIFEEFVQLGNAERDRRRGLGLGLSIASRSGALIGAAIDVSSRLGRGSCFGFVQPAAGPANATAIVTRVQPLAKLNTLGVLVVDDDPSVRKAIAGLFTGWGVVFETAADASAALTLVDEGARFASVIADYRLPHGMDGLAMIAALVARHGDAPPACALVTGDFDPGLLAKAASMGIQVLAKPLRPADLRGLLGLEIAGQDSLAKAGA